MTGGSGDLMATPSVYPSIEDEAGSGQDVAEGSQDVSFEVK
jgi:hypothetical protein